MRKFIGVFSEKSDDVQPGDVPSKKWYRAKGRKASHAFALCLIVALDDPTPVAKALKKDETPHVTVRIFIRDYAATPAKILDDAKKVAGAIFREAGLELVWLDRGFRPGYLILNIVPGVSAELTTIKNAAGLAVLAANGPAGSVAYIFSDRIDRFSPGCRITKAQVLAHTMAHEIGHLMLRTGAHAPRGLMRAEWNLKDFEKMARQNLLFSEEQSRLMKEGARQRNSEIEPVESVSLEEGI